MLDQIPGVGPTLRTSLLKTLGSAKGVREASVADLASVPKITPKLAQRIYDFFHPDAAAADPTAGGAEVRETDGEGRELSDAPNGFERGSG